MIGSNLGPGQVEELFGWRERNDKLDETGTNSEKYWSKLQSLVDNNNMRRQRANGITSEQTWTIRHLQKAAYLDTKEDNKSSQLSITIKRYRLLYYISSLASTVYLQHAIHSHRPHSLLFHHLHHRELDTHAFRSPSAGHYQSAPDYHLRGHHCSE